MHAGDDRSFFIVIAPAHVILLGVGGRLNLGGGVILRTSGVLCLRAGCIIQHRGFCREFRPGFRGLFIP